MAKKNSQMTIVTSLAACVVVIILSAAALLLQISAIDNAAWILVIISLVISFYMALRANQLHSSKKGPVMAFLGGAFCCAVVAFAVRNVVPAGLQTLLLFLGAASLGYVAYLTREC